MPCVVVVLFEMKEIEQKPNYIIILNEIKILKLNGMILDIWNSD